MNESKHQNANVDDDYYQEGGEDVDDIILSKEERQENEQDQEMEEEDYDQQNGGQLDEFDSNRIDQNQQHQNKTTPAPISESSTSTFVIRLLKKALRFLNLRQMVKNIQQGKLSSATCLACKMIMTGIKYLIDYGRGLEDVLYVSKYLCNTFNIQTKRVCNGYVDIFMEEFVVVMSKVNVSSNEMCGFLYGETCNYVGNPLYKWHLTIPDKPLFFYQKPFSSLFRYWPFRMQQQKYFKVLQITDLHIDLEYQENSNAVCGEPLCCRSTSPGSKNPMIKKENQAGYWGDYRDCDIPLRLVDETFKLIRQNHQDIDYIIWTGDIPPHDIWNQTKEMQLNYIDLAGQLFKKYFNDIPIYPSVGNHETLPMNSFPSLSKEFDSIDNIEKYSKKWLYDKLKEIWLNWLPEDTKNTIEKGAYFSTRVRKGLKLISLNTNFCNSQNWWILLNSTDPGQQLEWLIKELLESERIGEMVQIIGHVPPGSNDCVQIWSKNYNEIINRFASIIKGQFFGHTHNDEFEIFYKEVKPIDLEQSSSYHHETTYLPTNIAYIGPSLTTFGNVNPGYRIYLIDQETYDIIDYETYYLNLTEANLNGPNKPLNYRMAYSARDKYELYTLSPSEWHRLVMRMRTPDTFNLFNSNIYEEYSQNLMQESNRLFKSFHKYFYNLSDNIGDDNKCNDDTCKYEMLCKLLMANSHNTTLCEHFLLYP